MKFDCVVMNPPYQGNSNNKGVGHTLWGKFVELAMDSLVNEDGYLCAVHPSGWRRPTGTFRQVGEKLIQKQIEYLSIHSLKEGQETFKACTRYDWHVTKNTLNKANVTVVRCEDGEIVEVDLPKMPFIPNGEFDEILKLLPGKAEEKIEVIKDKSSYETRRKWMDKKQTEEFNHPCIYSLPKKGIQFRYSSRKDKGHFGIPKVIFGNGAASQLLVDGEGKYGLTEWAYGIVDDIENLPKIKQAMESKRFIELCKYMRFTLDRYDVNFISCLRKDFWKEFV